MNRSEKLAARIAELEQEMQDAREVERGRARETIARAAERCGLVEAVADDQTTIPHLADAMRSVAEKIRDGVEEAEAPSPDPKQGPPPEGEGDGEAGNRGGFLGGFGVGQ